MPPPCALHLVHGPNPHTRAAGLDQLASQYHKQQHKQGRSQLPSCAVLASAELLLDLNEAQALQRTQADQAHKACGLHWQRLAPGCLCCSSKLILSTHLGRTLRLVQPNVLLLELDSSSHPNAVWALLQQPQWQGWFGTLQSHGFGLTPNCPVSTLEFGPQNPI